MIVPVGIIEALDRYYLTKKSAVRLFMGQQSEWRFCERVFVRAAIGCGMRGLFSKKLKSRLENYRMQLQR
jgi:hypothetical protein